MNFKDWFLNEMPLRSLTHIPPVDNPAWAKTAPQQRGWNPADVGIIAGPGIEKFKKLWERTDHNYDFYLIRYKNASKFREIGEVSRDWMDKNFAGIPGIEQIGSTDDGISIVFTNNLGSNKVPFTAWTAAHRFAHAMKNIPEFITFVKILQRDMTYIMSTVYHQEIDRSDIRMLRKLAHKLGTMKSARLGKLNTFYEFAYELVAQYLMTKNKVQFNSPAGMLITHYYYGHPQGIYNRLSKDELAEFQEEINGMADQYNDLIDNVLDHCISKIFVM